MREMEKERPARLRLKTAMRIAHQNCGSIFIATENDINAHHSHITEDNSLGHQRPNDEKVALSTSVIPLKGHCQK